LALVQPQPANGLRALVARLAAENGVPYGLANAVVTIESRYNPHASNGGALGLMQIKAQTARGLGFQGGAAGLLDPGTNLHFGMRYLALAYHQAGGNLCATVMRYQSGTAARHMTAANRAYCSRASALIGRS
jgi:soluble lytic murein transglycosylase-like protein